MAPSTCIICNNSPANACGTCKSAFYCSKVCQALDWSLHKVLCRKFTRLPPKPSATSKLGILLSAQDPDPTLVWVPSPKAQLPRSSTLFDQPSVQHLLGPDNPAPEKFNVGKNVVRGYALDHTVVIYARDNWLNDGSKPNQAALALTDWKLPYDWRGNIVVMSYTGKVAGKRLSSEADQSSATTFVLQDEGGDLEPFKDYQDATMGDFRTAIDFFSHYGMQTERKKEHSNKVKIPGADGKKGELGEVVGEIEEAKAQKEKNRKVKGVIIRCEGDIGLHRNQTGKWERYSEIEVAKDHAIWKESPTEASKIMGLPILVHKLPHNPAWNRDDHTRFDNQPATFLNLTVEPSNEELWGFAPPEWQMEVGSVLLVRKDQKDISREQAWALAEYMQFKVSDDFEDAMESGETKKRRQAVIKMLNWSRFDQFLKNFKVEMTAADHKSWKDVKSPFGTREGPNEPF